MMTSREPLSEALPELAKEAIDLDGDSVSTGSNKRYIWVCVKGHQYEMEVTARVRGRGCNICSNTFTHFGYNDLAATHPQIAAEADGWDTAKVTFRSGQKRAWICEFGHKWNAHIYHSCRIATSVIQALPSHMRAHAAPQKLIGEAEPI